MSEATTVTGFEVTGETPISIPGVDARLMRQDTARRRPAVPTVDPGYVFRADLVRELSWCVWPPDGGKPTNLLLAGPKGSGKTSLVAQVAALCNIPVYRVNLNAGTTVRHLKGRLGAEQGRTVFVPGIVTLAMEAGAWLLLDELSAVTPQVAMALFPVLEPDGEVLLEDAQPPRYVRRHPRFRVFGTDNTIGSAMEAARFNYSGTNPDMNAAILDRFGGMVEIGYLPPEQEAAAITAKYPAIDPMLLEGMVIVANQIRSSDMGGFSFRMLDDWSRRVASGYLRADGTREPIDDEGRYVFQCAEAAFLRRLPSQVERDAMAEVIRRTFVVAG